MKCNAHVSHCGNVWNLGQVRQEDLSMIGTLSDKAHISCNVSISYNRVRPKYVMHDKWLRWYPHSLHCNVCVFEWWTWSVTLLSAAPLRSATRAKSTKKIWVTSWRKTFGQRCGRWHNRARTKYVMHRKSLRRHLLPVMYYLHRWAGTVWNLGHPKAKFSAVTTNSDCIFLKCQQGRLSA